MREEKIKAGPGRPRGFDVDHAMDVAIQQFWAHGYDGFDMDTLAALLGTSKPALYRVFGDKGSLFLRAIERYNQVGAERPSRAFLAASSLRDAVQAFLFGSVSKSLQIGHPAGCFLVSIAALSSNVEAHRAYNDGLQQLAKTLAARFKKEMPPEALGRVAASQRAWMMIDLAQALALRARTGSDRKGLLLAARNYVSLILA